MIFHDSVILQVFYGLHRDGQRVLLVVEIAGTWMEPVAVAVGMRTCDCKSVKSVESVGGRILSDGRISNDDDFVR